ncbi:NACHT domain-containing protein [Streptomyces sp. NPDC020412]|uniref:NACHT domain-containing protein n=1 Tax=Streptomyces sp. NPDC020412 TaxID=3365073 RepID=UPI00379491DE
MDASTLAVRLASSALAPLIRKLFVPGQPGAGLADQPVRLAALVSFRGEQRTLGNKGLRRLAAALVDRAADAYGPHEAPSARIRDELTDALTTALHSLGDLDMDDVQAVRLGPQAFAARLARPADLSADVAAYFDPLLHTACLHVLDFFSTRSTFVARTLVEQSRAVERLVAATDLLLARNPSPLAADTRFEQRYAEHVQRKYGELTIYGLDLNHAREWPLDAAYVSLEVTADGAVEAPVALPAEHALAGQGRVLLRGAAGSGKTTLVQWLAVVTARQDLAVLGGHLSHLIGRVPFVLPMRRVLRDGQPPTPDEFLPAVRSAIAGAQPDGWVDRVLRAGRALLLVDGVDEIPQRERDATRRWLRELMAEFPGNLWLVTTRPLSVADDWLTGERFTSLTLAPMQRTEVERFVRRWHAAAGADDALATALVGAVHTNDDLGRLAVNPLMCGLLCALHRERRGFLPNGRKELYEAALRMLLERRDVERGVATDGELRLSSDTSIALLQKLAHWLVRNGRSELTREDALVQLTRALTYMSHVPEPPERVLRHLIERSGLLREPAAGRLDFVHRTFQDYLAAKALVEEGDFPLLLDRAHDDLWEDVVRMAVALGRPTERARIVNGLLDRSVPTDNALRRILLAASCLDQALEIDPAVVERTQGLVADLIPPLSAEMARKLAEAGGSLVARLLPGPEGLTDRDSLFVVATASYIGTDAALAVLVRYRDHPSLSVRRQLAWAWERFDTEEYVARVLAHVDPEGGLYFTAHSLDHLKALRAMGGRERVQVNFHYDPHELVTYLDPELLTHLWLPSGYVDTGENWLAEFPRLCFLDVPSHDEVRDEVLPPSVIVVQVDTRYWVASDKALERAELDAT